MSFKLWWRADRPVPPLHESPWSPLALVITPHGHWCGSQMLAPSRRPTAMCIVLSSKRSPHAESVAAVVSRPAWRMLVLFDCNVVINEDYYYYYYYYHVSSVQAWSRSGVTEHSTTFCAGQRPPLTQPSLNSVLGGWTASMNPVREFPRVFFVHVIHAET